MDRLNQLMKVGLSGFMLWMIFTAGGFLAFDAQAAPFRMTGYDTAAIGSANSEIVYGSSYGVLSTNPALMSRYEPSSSIEFILMKPSLKVNLMDRPQNADISIMLYNTQIDKYKNNPDVALPTSELRESRADHNVDELLTYISTGITYSFGIKGFRAGGFLILPVMEQIDAKLKYYDERESFFSNTVHLARFGEWSPQITGMLGVSYSPIKYVSFGAALQASAMLVAGMDIYVPDAQVQDYALTNAETTVTGKLRPIIGVQVEPLDWMALGITWKWRSYAEVDGSGKMQLWNFHETFEAAEEAQTTPKRVTIDSDFVLDYEPMELTGGLGFRYAGWNIQGAFTWNRWVDYRDDHAQRPQESAVYASADPRFDEDGVLIYGPSYFTGDDYKWSDTFSTNIGTSWQYVDWAKTSLGFSWYNSPVPAQTGRTSYADSDTWCLALGQRFDFTILEQNFNAALGFQFWQMIQRTVYKNAGRIQDEFPDDSITPIELAEVEAAKGLQTNNPGFPGYTVKGWMIVSSLSLGFEF